MCITETHDVHQIANIEKKVPLEWITEDDFVTEDLIHYIRPLIQAELSPIMVDGLPRHLNVNMDQQSKQTGFPLLYAGLLLIFIICITYQKPGA